ncbi:MAG: class B sortase [Clostridiales Family XIII bacterium]|jgi:sortase B|nr:class B sortase [Clostridiales Family XIII bacterium]
MSTGIKKHLLTLGIIVCGIIFILSAYVLISYLLEGRAAEADFDELRTITEGDGSEPADEYADMVGKYRELYARNSDFVGWLRVYGMDIDYPVMQTPGDPEYYLHRNFDKEYSKAGTFFASAITDIEKPSDVTIIYGHRMKNGSMFGKLPSLDESDFYKEHRYIRFDTLTERRSYEIFCVYRTLVDTGEASEYRYYDYTDFADEADFEYFISEAKQREYFDTGVDVSYGDEIILLSTCESVRENGRVVVMGKRIPDSEAPNFSK